jgi:hypothetical protein
VRRLGRAVQLVGPWVAVGVFVWRQQTLEVELERWLTASNKAIQESLERFMKQATEYIEQAAGVAASKQ